MDPESFLLTVSELALATVGFSAIVVALGVRDQKSRAEYYTLLTVVMVEFGFATLLFSLLPVVISFFEIGEGRSYSAAAGLMALFYVVYFPLYQRRRTQALVEAERSPKIAYRLRLAVTYSIAAILALAAAGLVPFNPIAVYTVGLSWLLFLAALGLLFTIRQRG